MYIFNRSNGRVGVMILIEMLKFVNMFKKKDVINVLECYAIVYGVSLYYRKLQNYEELHGPRTCFIHLLEMRRFCNVRCLIEKDRLTIRDT